MTRVQANGIEITYEPIGKAGAPPLLLVSGHGAQMIGWDDDFCEQLADRGFQVIRFDNRDVGLSTKIEDAPEPDVLAAVAGDAASAAYTLADMADDATGLLEAIGIDAAHVVGASMGGMIAQWLAIRHPSNTLSLTSIMSTTGDRTVGLPTPEALETILRPPAQSMEESIERAVDSYRRFASPGFSPEVDRVRMREERQHRRCWYPQGATRQLLAILASGDWTSRLRSVRAPALVIHGDSDPVITPDGGEATARAIPGAELLLIPGMAHDIPEPLWPTVFDAIEQTTRRATAAAQA